MQLNWSNARFQQSQFHDDESKKENHTAQVGTAACNAATICWTAGSEIDCALAKQSSDAKNTELLNHMVSLNHKRVKSLL